MKPDINGLKIQDLEPLVPAKKPTEIDIQVSTFTLPADKLDVLEKISEICLKTPLKFIDKALFDNNGLWAAFAMKEQWIQIASLLQESDAVRIASDTLLIFDENGYEFFKVNILQKSVLQYEDTEGHVKMDLDEGHIAWSIKARCIKSMQGTAAVRVELVHKKNLDIAAAKMKRQLNVREHVFNFSSMAARMSVGDIILLSSVENQPEAESVNNLMFSGRRKVHKDNAVREIDVIKLFVIVCTEVKNDIF